jgi:prepilin-type N-terminal cleavage/methylation domain-containing protein
LEVQTIRHESGFTLVELSIVIVIIGLIVGSFIGGQALVEQAKMRKQISCIF